MPIARYKGHYPQPTRDLYELGVLKGYPSQKTIALFRDYGVNITYRFKKLTPEKFKLVSNLLLEVAKEEADRYPEYKWRFARIEVKLSRTAKGRKSLPNTQTYTASKHTDSQIMVYGPGYEIEEKIFLIDQVEKILDIPTRYLGRVNKQRPYVVTHMTIALRAGEPLPISKLDLDNPDDKEDELL